MTQHSAIGNVPTAPIYDHQEHRILHRVQGRFRIQKSPRKLSAREASRRANRLAFHLKRHSQSPQVGATLHPRGIAHHSTESRGDPSIATCPCISLSGPLQHITRQIYLLQRIRPHRAVWRRRRSGFVFGLCHNSRNLWLQLTVPVFPRLRCFTHGQRRMF